MLSHSVKPKPSLLCLLNLRNTSLASLVDNYVHWWKPIAQNLRKVSYKV